MELTSGARVGGYEVLEPLGRGGQSQVYKALDVTLKRVVALKVLSERLLGDEVARQRLLLEARALSSFNHPGIATVYQIGEIEGCPFIAMEYVEGQTLHRCLQGGELTLVDKLVLLVEIGDAVGYAHRKGIVHRDLKPGNVMVTPEGRVKLLDFGLAKLTSESLRERMSVAGEVTSAGSLVGTVSYVSPEQARGESLDARTDLWALGVIAYEMLSGRRPFECDTPAAILMAILKDPTPPLPPEAAVPAPVPRIVARLLEKDPALRYPSADDLLNELGAACIELGVPLPLATQRWASGGARTMGGGGRTLRGPAGGRTEIAPGYSRGRGQQQRALVAAAVAALAIVAVALAVRWLFPRPPAVAHGEGVLVLPLEASGDPDRRNLAGLVTGQLVDSLSRAARLRVLALPEGQSTGRAGANELARRGGVRYVVDGNLFLNGNQLALTLKVTERAGARVLWSETERAPLDQVFAMAARQASGAAGALGVYVAAGRVDFPGEQAFDDFARGSLALASYDPSQLAAAIDLLERCVAASPRFAPAYPKLARALLQYRNLGVDYSPAYLDRAGAVIRAGLEVDPGDPDLRVNLAWLRLYTYDFRGAHEAAARLGPLGGGTPTGCKLVVWDKFFYGEIASALVAVGQCRASFPLDSSILLNLVVLNTMAGNREAALAASRDVEEVHASELVSALARSWLALARGEPRQAKSEVRDAWRRSGALMLGLQAAEMALAARDYPAVEEGLDAWLARNPYSLEAHWMRCLARDLTGDTAGARQAAADAVHWAGELDRRYHNATTRLTVAYFTVRSGGHVRAEEVKAVDLADEALLPAWLQQLTLARLGVPGALSRPITPYSPTFWLNRFAPMELELQRTRPER